jgi:hypothetical protein
MIDSGGPLTPPLSPNRGSESAKPRRSITPFESLGEQSLTRSPDGNEPPLQIRPVHFGLVDANLLLVLDLIELLGHFGMIGNS